MSRSLLYVRVGKMYYTDGSAELELPSETLRHYIRTTRERAQSKEWKTTGTGAAFLGEQRGQDAETAVSQIRSQIHTAVYDRGAVYYSMTLDKSSGIYRKDPADLSNEGIVLSDRSDRFEEFSLMPDRKHLLFTQLGGGEKHVGILDLESGENRLLTEGNTHESDPIADPHNPDRILFSTCGLAEYAPTPHEDGNADSRPVRAPIHGPTSICALNLNTGMMETVIGDSAHDYLHPAFDSQGNLLCIRRPYQPEKSPFSLGCLIDVFLFFPRLIWALVKFLSVFSTAFSGTSLTKSTDVKAVRKSDVELMIDGNRIKAEEELKKNARAGDKHPGIIPRSWELIRMDDEKPTVLAKGVCALLPDGNDLYLSNGSSLLRMRDGTIEEVLKARGITCIRPVDR